MANKWAVQNGNWSDGSTWNDGVVPTADDDVWLNGYEVSVQYDNTYYANSISNIENQDLGVNSGGHLYESSSSDYTKSIYIVANLNAVGNIISFKNRIDILGNVTGKTNSTNKQDAILFTVNYQAYHTITGNVTLLEGNVGFLIMNNNGSCYTGITINGNIEINGGMLYQYSGYSVGATYLNGSITIRNSSSQISPNISSNEQAIVNGDVTIENGAQLGGCGSAVFNGTITADENSLVANHLGTATFNGEVHSYFNISGYRAVIANQIGTNVNFNGGLWLHNGDQLDSNFLINVNLSNNAYNLNFKKHFDVGNIKSFGSYNTTSPYIPIGNINVLGENAEFHYNNPYSFFYALHWNIEHPESFSIINDYDSPSFVMMNYSNNRFNYPQEDDVKVNVEYGMQNEYKGRYTPTVLTDEQLQRIANCVTNDTLQATMEDYFGGE